MRLCWDGASTDQCGKEGKMALVDKLCDRSGHIPRIMFSFIFKKDFSFTKGLFDYLQFKEIKKELREIQSPSILINPLTLEMP